ncbi:hypothetical protein CKO36_11320 [Rhabdochromatium marinum]|nr:hypothetical protein [Rhabdochromatium marinum]
MDADDDLTRVASPQHTGWHRAPALPSPWLGNLLVFGLLMLLTLVAFFLQTRSAEQRFIAEAAEHSRLLADAVRLHARGAVLAGEATDTILTAFLGNSARFVRYLDDIEAFTADELTAFAAEAGLALIGIQRGPAAAPAWVLGSPDGAERNLLRCAPLEQLRPWSGDAGFSFSVDRGQRPGCILVAMKSAAVEALREAISVPQALQTIGQLPGVLGAQLEGEPRAGLLSAPATDAPPHLRLYEAHTGITQAEARAPIAGAELVLQLDAKPLMQRRRELWLAFGGFLLALLATGALGTWLLVRVQRAHEQALRDYERRLSAQREEASLGRAAATIAHEIRNPLNAIGLGLQRLKLEATSLDPSQQALIERVTQALQRTNGTVARLLDYARPGQRERQSVDLTRLLTDALAGQRVLLDARAPHLQVELPEQAWVPGDAAQLRRALDNLLGNACEALPEGGQLEIALVRVERASASGGSHEWQLSLTNDGLIPMEQPLAELLEPWVTHKTEGTGLGLAIVRRIVQAHHGRLALNSPAPGRLRVRLWLPVV